MVAIVARIILISLCNHVYRTNRVEFLAHVPHIKDVRFARFSVKRDRADSSHLPSPHSNLGVNESLVNDTACRCLIKCGNGFWESGERAKFLLVWQLKASSKEIDWFMAFVRCVWISLVWIGLLGGCRHAAAGKIFTLRGQQQTIVENPTLSAELSGNPPYRELAPRLPGPTTWWPILP